MTEIKSYLVEMRVSPALLDLMEGTPPEKLRYLSTRELEDVGLSAPDPVWDEQQVAKRATWYGLTSSELRRRQAKADSTCPDPRSADLSKIQAQIDCIEATLWSLPLDVYMQRKATFMRWKENLRRSLAGRPVPPEVPPRVQACEIKAMTTAILCD